jgi:hypothetical protein
MSAELPRSTITSTGRGRDTMTFDAQSNYGHGDLMPNLIGLVLLAVATFVLWLSRKHRWPSEHPIAFRAALIVAYAGTLLLALRFGARTYPGLFIGRPGPLNDILNSSQIFGIGYNLVALAALADGLSFWLARRSAPASQVGARAVLITRNVCLVLATLGALYGFYFAIVLERLPWQPD